MSQTATDTETVILADCATVHVSEKNTRQPTLKQVTASGLLESIREQGQLTPGLARPHPTIKGAYELAAGACRHTACTALKIPLKIVVREMTDGELLDAILTENLQRTDPEPEAEAELIQLRLDEGLTPGEIAARYGKDAIWVKRRMKILAVIPAIRKNFLKGKPLEHFSTEMKERVGDLDPAMQKTLSENWNFRRCHTFADLKDLIARSACSLEGQDFVNDPATAVPGCSEGCATDTSKSLFAEDKGSCGNCLNQGCFMKRREIATGLAIAALIGDKPISDFVLYSTGYNRQPVKFKGQELKLRDQWEVERHYKFSKKKTELLAINFKDPAKPKITYLEKPKTSSGSSPGAGKKAYSREEKLTAKRLAEITEDIRSTLEKAPIPTLIPLINLVATFGTSSNHTYIHNKECWGKASGDKIASLCNSTRHADAPAEEVVWRSLVSIFRQRIAFNRSLDLLEENRKFETARICELIEYPYEAKWAVICTEKILVPKSWGAGIDPITLKPIVAAAPAKKEASAPPKAAKKAAKKEAKKEAKTAAKPIKAAKKAPKKAGKNAAGKAKK
jgi:ParB/RepB/Spo0J family partition protein